MGPITPTSIGGSHYVPVVVDTATRFSWVRFLKSKDKAKDKLIEINNKEENRLEKSVKRILTNGGKEFVNKFTLNFCANRGIENITTTPYTPQHNGIVERLNCTLLDKARAMRVETGVPKELWAELIDTANFSRLRTSEGSISPWEKKFNIKPNLKRIKRFGYVRSGEDKLPLINKAIDNTKQIEYGSFKRIEPGDKTVISALEDTQESQINAPVSPLETTQTKTENADLSSQIAENITEPLEVDNNNCISVALTAKETVNQKFPATYEAAKRSPEAIKWKEAAFSEFDSIIDRGVFELMRSKNVPNEKNIINTRWVFTKKLYEKRQLKKYKGRFFVKGFKQKEGIDYTETFSPTGRLTTLRFLLSHATLTNQKVRQANFVTAYLNSKLPEDGSAYIELPDVFVDWLKETKPTTYIEDIGIKLVNNPKPFVIKLKKALYGLKQAAGSWYETSGNWLIKNGFVKSMADACLFIGKDVILFAWVDDIILIGKEANNIPNKL
ncbi:hypothetical protein O181_014220 [Austropuccinia psidii MF-1]|uniref:Integrase catalytic domain-containing protein n=1 Tax=Austropuccinia psidii MF-1 TaxID=1389203 RepID=A0A9Q3GPQ0_9BASI|nr:hypothetical protein [Austropuccinia psidii MF-1]